MAQRSSATRTARFILTFTALFFPMATLLPLGGLYLWEKGWVLWWTLGALIVVSATVTLQRWWLDAPERRKAQQAATASQLQRTPDRPVSPLEQRAWEDVRGIADNVVIDEIDSMDALLQLGQRTVDTVARRLHAEKKDAVWQFTLPEALAITEQVSARLGVLVDSTIPFGDRLTVAQVMAVYRWRHLVDVAERAYDIWRLVRVVNPATAVTAEARERMSRAMLRWGREHIARQFAVAFVEETGRAAIDLYSGRLKYGVAGHRSLAAEIENREAARIDVLRLLVLGSAMDRDTIVLAVERELAVRVVDDERAPLYDVKTTDAIGDRGVARRQLLRASSDADVLLWLVRGGETLAPSDLAARDLLKAHFDALPRQLPPVVVVGVIVDTDAVMINAEDAGRLRLDASGPERNVGTEGGEHLGARVIRIQISPELRSGDIERLAVELLGSERRARHVAALRRRAEGRGVNSLVAAGGKALGAAASLASRLWNRGDNGGK